MNLLWAFYGIVSFKSSILSKSSIKFILKATHATTLDIHCAIYLFTEKEYNTTHTPKIKRKESHLKIILTIRSCNT